MAIRVEGTLTHVWLWEGSKFRPPRATLHLKFDGGVAAPQLQAHDLVVFIDDPKENP